MFGQKFFPYSTLQELNLDWILTKVKNILRFVPDDGVVGQILRRTPDGAEWSNEQGGGGAVDSVNGQTGTVVLTASDVGALPDSYTAPVTSVNTKTGAVVLDKTDIGLGNVANVAQYSASNPPPYPVTSVNGQTGAVSVSVPTKTSDLNNDSGFVTSAQAASAAPVQSVNSQTGAVSLGISDIGLDYFYYSVPLTILAGGNIHQTITFAQLGIPDTYNVLIANVRQQHTGSNDDVWRELFVGWSFSNTNRNVQFRVISARNTSASPTFIVEAVAYRGGNI